MNVRKANPVVIAGPLLLLFLLALAPPPPCRAEAAPAIPAPLAPWVEWAWHGHEEERQCIPHYNDPGRLECDWPTALVIDLHDRGGEFRQTWLNVIYQGEG